MGLVLAVALVAASFTIGAGSSMAARRSDRVIIGLRRGADAGAVVRALGGVVTYRYSSIRAVAATMPSGALRDLRRSDGVRWVQHDITRQAFGLVDAAHPYQGSPEFIPWGVTDVRASEVWDANHNMAIDNGAPAGRGVTVAVIDNGADFTHPDIGSAYDIGLSARFLSAGCSPTDDITGEDQGHGVAAASVIAASSGNGDDHSGSKPPVSFPAKLPAVIAVGATDDTRMLADFSSFGNDQELVAPGVDVPMDGVQGTGVDSGLRIAGTNPPAIANLALEFSALGTANGALVFIGQGTTGDVAGRDLTDTIALIERGSISFGEKVANAAAAGADAAIVFNNLPGNFSGTHGEPGSIPAISIAAEDGARLLDRMTSGPVSATVEVAHNDYLDWSGTSFSAPHVAGVVALLLSADPSLTPSEVRHAIDSTATDLGKAGYDQRYGYGLVDACAAIDAVGGRCG